MRFLVHFLVISLCGHCNTSHKFVALSGFFYLENTIIGDFSQINSILVENLFDLGLIPLVRWKCIDFHRRCSAYWHSRTDIGVKIWISSSQGNRTESTFDIKLGGSNKFYVGSRETRVFLSTLHLQDLDLDLVSRVIRLNLCRPCFRIDYYFLHHRDSELI